MTIMDEILFLSQQPECYMWFLSVFLKNTVIAKTWNKLHLRQPISKFVTPSTEAVVLLILENSYNRWLDEAENPLKCKKELAHALYTNAGISQRDGPATSKKGGGWSDEGIHRFNELVSLIKTDRKNRYNFEMLLMKKMQEENTVKAWSNEKRKANVSVDVAEVVAVNDFDDSEEEDNDEQIAQETRL
jgi:hypothetical protein